jgi:hypothetical protein
VVSVILALSLLIVIYMFFFLLPDILTTFTVTTNIEMMKDKELIVKVVSV